MQTDNGQTVSVWMQANTPEAPKLVEDTEADVCVVGAGIAGLTTAYLLAKAGKEVVVLDDGPTGGGDSARTTAHLACYIDDGLTEIERVHGPDGLRLAVESHAAAINAIERIVVDENIDCEFRRLDAYLFRAPAGEDFDWMERELEAARRTAPLAGAEWVDRVPLAAFDTGRAIRFPNQGQFHVLKYLDGVARALARLGGRVFNRTHADGFESGPPAIVTSTEGRRVRAEQLVVATNSPANNKYVIHSKQAPYRTYAIGLRVPGGTVPTALLWDTLEDYHYVRLQHGGGGETGAGDDDVLIVGGEDHKTGEAKDPARRFDALEQWARERFASAGEVVARWSGQVLEPLDGLAFIGRNPGGDGQNVFIATGDSGMGMTHGTIAGLLISDLILGRPNPWEALYNPARKPLKAAAEYLKENLDVARQYADLVTPGEVGSADEITPGEGAILRRGLKKLAVYKDPQGVCHERSAICPHLQCVVAWNTVEKTWDCPCHGSRFNTDGRTIQAPAVHNLAPVE